MSTLPPSRRRVVVIDDRHDILFLLKTLLLREGFEVFTAENGREGLEAVKRFAPQAVISDLSLGGEIDGFALVRAVRNDPELTLPSFIAVTGFDDDEHRRLAREAGFDHYLVKPTSIAQLRAVLPK